MSKILHKIMLNGEEYLIRDSSAAKMIGDLSTALSKKADKATTLSGYSIGDAYKKSEIDGMVDAVMSNFGGVSQSLSNKQDKLVSGTNIKSINGTSLLGSGNLEISAGGASDDEINVINEKLKALLKFYQNTYQGKISILVPANGSVGIDNREIHIQSIHDASSSVIHDIGKTYYIYNSNLQNKDFKFSEGDYNSFGDNSSLIIPRKVILGQSDSTAHWVFYNTDIIAGKYKIFGGDIIKGLLGCNVVYPEWWGAVGDGVTDDSDAIQAAIDNAGHIPVVLTSQKGYLVKKTINLIEPFGKENINKYFYYTNSNGSTYNCYQTLIVMHDIIGDESLAGPVIRTGSNMNRIEVRGAIVVRNASDDAVGISCAGTQYEVNPYKATSGADNINTGDLGTWSEIKINAIIKGADSFPYYDASDSAATKYGLGKGTAVLYGGGYSSVLDVRHIYGFENGVWITFANGCTINIGECGCFNDIKIDGTTKTWGGGVTRNKIRLDSHNLSNKWGWVKNKSELISIIKIGNSSTVNNYGVEVANNEFSVGGSNDVNLYCTYNYFLRKEGNNAKFTGNVITCSSVLLANKVNGEYMPISIVSTLFGNSNNGNKLVHMIAWDYNYIHVNYSYNTEISPVIIDGDVHTSCYRFGNTPIDNRFFCEKVIMTYLDDDDVGDGVPSEFLLVPHITQLNKCHVVDSVSTTDTSTYKKGHLYIKKAVVNDKQFHEAWGWNNGEFKKLGYYVDTFGLVK